MKPVCGKEDNMKIKRSKGENLFSIVNYVILTFIMLLCLYPILYVAMASISDSSLLTQQSGILYKPLGFSIDAYKKVFANPMI